jgi:hypothetical protein
MQNINREHPEYIARKAMWKQYRDLYAGGERLRTNASDYLVRRHKEPGEIYQERLNRVFYENYIGSIVDWYAATLIRRAPAVAIEGNDAAAKDYFSVLAANCDLKDTSLSEFFRQRFVQTMVYGCSYTVVDFPRANGAAMTRAEEDASGRSRAYLVDYSPEEVINWNHDETGGLEWAVIRTTCLQQSKVTDARWERETRWIYYDRENFQIYRKAGEASPVELVDEGQHGLAALRRVPLFRMQVSEGLWLTNKAALLQLEHFNKSNALAWALTMGLFATPVVFGSGMEPDCRGVVLHPTGAAGPLRVDGAGGEGLSDCGGQPGSAQGRNLPGLLSDEPSRNAERRGSADFRHQQAEGLQRDAGGTAGVWRRGEGKHEAGAAGDWGGAAGRSDDRRSGAGRIRYRRLQRGVGRREEAAGFGNRVGDAEEAGVQEFGVQVFVRCAAGG